MTNRLFPGTFTAVKPQELILAVLLGVLGFLLNTFELQLGWGMHFIFGNAVIFAFTRVLAPRYLILAISISSLWTMILWHHPWAWFVWVFEAAFIAYYVRKNAPVSGDIIFWLLIGTPLLLLTYGGAMQMDQLSLLLVIVKQSANGILNIVIGELLYVTLIGLNPLSKFGHWPKLKIESVVITLLIAIILIPTAVYLALDAPAREQAARREVGQGLEYRLSVSTSSLNSWVQSRSLILRMYAEETDASDTLKKHAFDELDLDFSHISIVAPGQPARQFATSKISGEEQFVSVLKPSAMSAQRGVRLVKLESKMAKDTEKFALVVPYSTSGTIGVVVAQLRDGVLPNLTRTQKQDLQFLSFIVSPVQGVVALSAASLPLQQRVENLTVTQRADALASPVLLSDVGYGGAVMSDLRNAQILRSAIVAELPEWQVVNIAPLTPAVTQARKLQLRQFFALMAFVLIVTIIAWVLSRRITQTLKRLSQSAADLAAIGGNQYPMGRLVIQEVNEIIGTIASAGTSFGRERGALASYQRRLTSIAQHAPVIVYALDVVDGAKGELVYVSESLQRILGYSSADAMAPGWWSQAVHAEDYHDCEEAFNNLEPGKVVNVEYRLLHKDGFYVWVYDTLSVEAGTQSGRLEAVGVIMDISERKAASEQLLQADKMASLGRMISGTAHELNQPLNFIKMAASNLRESTIRGRMETDRFLPKLENVLAQVERASAILLQMRIFGRMPKESPYPVDVKASVDAVVLMVAPQFELDGTQLSMVDKGGQAYVRALPVLLEQVLLNLVLNANDAIQTRYASSETADGKIKISIERRSQTVAIIVEDNGTGIPADILRKIFDPFFTTKAPKEGTGLGLSISYGIIRDLGGVIRAKSSRNGARFTIELPLADVKEVTPELADIQPAN